MAQGTQRSCYLIHALARPTRADGLVALGTRLGRVFGKIRVLCDGGCAQVARQIGLGLTVAAL